MKRARASLLLLVTLLATTGGCGSSQQGSTVNVDPKTLVLQPGDYPSNWDAGIDYPPPSGSPLNTLGGLVTSTTRPIDGYLYYIPFENLTSAVALYKSTDEARGVYASIKVPSSAKTLSPDGFAVGDEQEVISWDPTSAIHEIDEYWQFENVIALLSVVILTNRNYPTTEDLATEFDPSTVLLIAPLGARMQTHIRLASHG